MNQANLTPAARVTAADQILDMATELAQLARDVREVSDVRLARLRVEEPVGAGSSLTRGPDDQMPAYFASLRAALLATRGNLLVTRSNIVSCEV